MTTNDFTNKRGRITRALSPEEVKKSGIPLKSITAKEISCISMLSSCYVYGCKDSNFKSLLRRYSRFLLNFIDDLGEERVKELWDMHRTYWNEHIELVYEGEGYYSMVTVKR